MATPDTMKAVVTTGHGDLNKLEYRDVPVPKPEAGEVLVQVTACGLNNTDIWVRAGAYGTDRDPSAITGTGRIPHTFPLIQGADVVGQIAAVGDGVDRNRVGERVICNFMTYAQGRPASSTRAAWETPAPVAMPSSPRCRPKTLT